MNPIILSSSVRDLLLSRRTAAGHWEGRLSSSALSTATAVAALALADRQRHAPLVRGGLDWLAAHQNADEGWGDTTDSVSNISTTVLAWAALAFGGGSDEERRAGAAAERWLAREAGGLDPRALARAIAARYGRDRTFSVPILTMAVLAGRLGAGREAWSVVAQLPFELAAFPQRWFRWLRLPVVSYALPALIAIGLVRHRLRPSRNPLARLVRRLVERRVLRVLAEIQPSSGGFLEAVPLTSFVVMSLAAAGLAAHPVAVRGVAFLRASVREDGSWPIDTNLATWVTTLSIDALSAGPAGALEAPDRARLVRWLLGQQGQGVHPYTGAARGGWAWTDLPGGVPDADDTAGALVALRHLAPDDARVRDAARRGVEWLLDLQNRDGGIPTFCRGWGTLPFDRSGADLTAHALLAWAVWYADVPAGLRLRLDRAMRRGVEYLARVQRPDGAFVPLWFGNQAAPDEENPAYGTARVLRALSAMERAGMPGALRPCRAAARWLLGAQAADGGWGGAPGVPPSVEETALAVRALGVWAEGDEVRREEAAPAIAGGLRWLAARVSAGDLRPSPIGFYFAKLWYSEALYPLIFATAALGSARPQVAGTSASGTQAAILAFRDLCLRSVRLQPDP